MNIDQN